MTPLIPRPHRSIGEPLVTRLLIIAATVAALMGPAATRAQAVAQCYPTNYGVGIYFFDDVASPHQVSEFYYFICNANTDLVTVLNCPTIRSELQGVVPANDDCYIGGADPSHGGTDTYTILDATRLCRDNTLAHKQHFGTGTVTYYETRTTGEFSGPYTYDLMTTWYNGPAYNRRCGVA